MKLLLTTSHFQSPSHEDLAEECEEARATDEPRSFVRLSRDGVEYISRYYVLVRNEADLASFPEKLGRRNEFGFSPLYDPKMIDACCRCGVFPMATSIGGIPLFAPKLHTERCLVRLVPDVAQFPRSRSSVDDENEEHGSDGLFNERRLGVSRELRRPPLAATRRPAFDVFFNRPEDVAGVLTLIARQHGEMWLCAPLRRCLVYMLAHPSEFATKIVITAVRRHRYQTENESEEPEQTHKSDQKVKKTQDPGQLAAKEKQKQERKMRKKMAKQGLPLPPNPNAPPKAERDDTNAPATAHTSAKSTAPAVSNTAASPPPKPVSNKATTASTKPKTTGKPSHPHTPSDTPATPPKAIEEGDLVAGEIGFLLGDIYTSATGAYCLSGAGSLQLAAMAVALRRAGCAVWDLGMAMSYKMAALGCVNVPRRRWQQMVAAHSGPETTEQVTAALAALSGANTAELLPEN